MQFFFLKKKKILTFNYGKQTKKMNTLLFQGIVYKKMMELKSERRSINGTRNEIFCAFKHAFFHPREMISLLRLSLEHIRQNADWMVMLLCCRDWTGLKHKHFLQVSLEHFSSKPDFDVVLTGEYASTSLLPT